MERFISGEWKIIFRNISHTVLNALTISGRGAWQEEKETRKDTSVVLILQEQSCTSELLKVILDAVSLILLYRTMLFYERLSSSTFIFSDVQSIYIPSSIRDWYQEVKKLHNRQSILSAWILWIKNTKILTRSTWMHRVMHNTCIKHGKGIKTQKIGSTSIMLWGKDWSSLRLGRTRSFFTKHFQLVVFRKLLGWKLEKPFTRKYLRQLGFHQRTPWNMIRKENWLQKMVNDQKDKLYNNPEGSNRTNRFQTQLMIERGNPLIEPIERGNPLLEQSREPCKMEEQRPFPRRSTHVLFTKKLSKPIERDNPLLKQTQKMCRKFPENVLFMKAWGSTLETKQFLIERSFVLYTVTNQVMSKQCWTRWTWTSEFQDYHILFWSKLRALVFENWSRNREPPRSTRSSTGSTTKQSV